MNVGLPGNDAVPIGLRNTKTSMGEIIDLERYRKLRGRREAEAKKAKHGDTPGTEKTEVSGTPSTVKRTEPRRAGPKGAAKTGGDDPKTD